MHAQAEGSVSPVLPRAVVAFERRVSISGALRASSLCNSPERAIFVRFPP